MQYILTQEEMSEKNKIISDYYKLQKILPSVEDLQEFCTYVADNLPSWKGWDGKAEARPWRCVLTVKKDHYCDECPAQKICPKKDKEWSK